jgi:hypothetical protein
VIELQPAVKEIRVRLGNSYFQSGTPDALTKAEEEYRAAVGIDEHYVDALYSMGVLLTQADRAEEGATWFRRALQESPPDSETVVTRQIRQYFETSGIPVDGPTMYTPSADSAGSTPPASASPS